MSARRSVTVLGATGSIGVSTLEVLEHLGGPDAFEMIALTGASNIRLLAAQARRWRPALAVTADPARGEALREALAGSGVATAAGPDAVREAGALEAEWVMAAIVGAAGLPPALEAARRGATVALANKESLVCAGALFLGEIARGGGQLIPVDSEHSAIFQVLEANAVPERIILTASGGPFREWTSEQMEAAGPAQAAAHPNWSMGAKISVDSASMFNKALETIEARWLFDAPPERIEVVVHPQSIVHSMVGYADGAILAQLGPPDMKSAIAYALSWPGRAALPLERLDFASLGRLDFAAPDELRFPALRLAREAMAAGGRASAVLNGAKEIALEAFLAEKIGFLDMARVVEFVLGSISPSGDACDLEEVFAIDGAARAAAESRIAHLIAEGRAGAPVGA